MFGVLHKIANIRPLHCTLLKKILLGRSDFHTWFYIQTIQSFLDWAMVGAAYTYTICVQPMRLKGFSFLFVSVLLFNCTTETGFRHQEPKIRYRYRSRNSKCPNLVFSIFLINQFWKAWNWVSVSDLSKIVVSVVHYTVLKYGLTIQEQKLF